MSTETESREAFVNWWAGPYSKPKISETPSWRRKYAEDMWDKSNPVALAWRAATAHIALHQHLAMPVKVPGIFKIDLCPDDIRKARWYQEGMEAGYNRCLEDHPHLATHVTR